MPHSIRLVSAIESGGSLLDERMYGIHVWPFVRVRMIEAGATSAPRRSLSLMAAWALMRGFVAAPLALLRFTLGTRAPRRRCVFLSHVTCLARFGTVWHDRFCDPIAEKLAGMRVDSAVLEYATALETRTPVARPRVSIAIGVVIVKALSIGVATVYASLRPWRMRALDAALRRHGVDAYIDAVTLNRTLAYAWCLRAAFGAVLRVTRPLLAFVCTYYSSTGMAFVLACRRAGVPVFDIQHGVQGEDHVAYRAWPAPGDEPYEAIPSGFWCWDEASAEHLESWCRPRGLRVVVGGNVWSEYVLERMRPGSGAAAGTLDDARTVVLVTLQPLKDPLRPLLLSAIEASGSDVTWVIRMHPGMTTGDIGAITRRLPARTRAEVRINTDADEPLPAVLASCDVHVTEYSSVVIEAAALGVRTVFLHPLAARFFPTYVDSGMAVAATTDDELLRLVTARDFGRGRRDPHPGKSERALATLLEPRMTTP